MTTFIPELSFEETAFMAFGACVREDPRYFDTRTRDGVTTMTGTVRIDGHRIRRIRAATHASIVCASCPVRRDCLDYITKYPSDTSIWAGLLPEERNFDADSF